MFFVLFFLCYDIDTKIKSKYLKVNFQFLSVKKPFFFKKKIENLNLYMKKQVE